MKRVLLAAALMGLMVWAGSWVLAQVQQTTEELLGLSSQAGTLAGSGNQEEALERARDFAELWRQRQPQMVRWLRHGEIEPIDEAISTLLPLLEGRETALFQAQLARLEGMLEHISITQTPLFQNIF